MPAVIVGNQVAVMLYDASGNPMFVANGAAVPTSGTVVAGSDGTNARFLRTANDGTVRIDPTGATTQPVSAASLPLPSGAATSANQTGGGQKTQVVDGSGNIMPSQDVAARAAFNKVTDGTNTMAVTAASAAKVDGSAVTQPVSGTVTANQGTANTAANRWPMFLTNGTQNMPTMDAAARAGFFQQTDGTNIAPTADVAARALYARITDGTNGMPTMDVVGRAGFQKVTDGTNTAAVKAASTAPVAADPALVTVISPNQQAIPVTNSPAGATTGIAVGEMTTTATADVVVRKTTYTEPASNAQRSVASSSASDTAAGTGARTIRITYYTATFTGPFTETITLNGTANVNTVATNICYIERIDVLTVGSNGSNVGTITLFGATAGGGGTVGTIAVGDNETFWTHHYVATGKTCYITGLSGNNTNSSNNTRLSIRAKDLSVAAAPDVVVSDTWVVGGGIAQTQRAYGTPVRVVGPARVSVFGAPAGTPSITTRASFDFYDA